MIKTRFGWHHHAQLQPAPSRSRARTFLTAFLLCALLAACGDKEPKSVRIAVQYGLVYLPIHVALEQKLIEKHGKALGLANVEVVLKKVGSGSTVVDALLSDSIDIGSGGIGPFIKVWAKTREGADIRGMLPLVRTPLFLNTNNPRIVSIKDFGEGDKIAVPAVKSSFQAVVLQMAAAKTFSEQETFRLDPFTVSMKHPDAMTALLSGAAEPRSHFATLPFAYFEKEDAKVHTVITSYEIVGGPHSTAAVWNTAKWKNENPKLYAAVKGAIVEAIGWINQHPKDAAELYARAANSKIPVDTLFAIVNDKALIEYNATPIHIGKFGEFLYAIKSIAVRPKSWDELFWQ